MRNAVAAFATVLLVACASKSGDDASDPTTLSTIGSDPAPGGGGPVGTGNSPVSPIAPAAAVPATEAAGAPAAPPPTSTGTVPPPPGPGAFAGASAYVATLGPSTTDVSGKGNGHLSFDATGNPAGHACLDCHSGAGKGGAPAFLFAGTVYQDVAGTKPVASAEVRMLGADGKGLSAYTDANGNFFFRQTDGTTTYPAIAGARIATRATSMTNKINDPNCNQCHTSGSRIAL